jgi:hypothetical protein
MDVKDFPTSADAEIWFRQELTNKLLYIDVRDSTVKEYVKGGRWAYPKLYTCDETDAYLLTYWKSRADLLWDSSQVTQEFKELDSRLKFTINTFGNGLTQMTQCKETTILHLLELEEKGLTTFMVTAYSNGDVFWIRTRDFYEFSTRYGAYQTFFRNPELALGLPYRVPTGWLLPWDTISLKSTIPQISGA